MILPSTYTIHDLSLTLIFFKRSLKNKRKFHCKFSMRFVVLFLFGCV